MWEVIFSGKDTSRKFLERLVSKQHKNVTVMAHNARAYNSYFVYNYLINNSIIPEIIFKGSKIMYCKINNQLNVRMLDSLNFLPMALSQLTKSFGLEELRKATFPICTMHPNVKKISIKCCQICLTCISMMWIT